MMQTTTRSVPGLMLAGFVLLGLLGGGCAGKKATGVWTDVPRPPAPPPVPAVRNEPLDPALQDSAEQEVRAAFQSSDPRLRANSIEAAQNTLGLDGARNMIVAGLDDKQPIVRFAAAMAAGKLRMNDLHDKLWSMASDPDAKVRLAVRFALHKLGDTRLSQELVPLAVAPDPRLREEVAFIFGQLGEKSAVKILQAMMNDSDADVRIQAADSLWRLGDEGALDSLVAGMVSRYVDDQMLCLQAMGGPKDPRVSEYVRGKLTDPYDEVRLVAAQVLGQLGMDAGYGVALSYVRASSPRQRYLAAFALGAIGRSDAQPSLAPLLKDSDPGVRLAAAQAILSLHPPSAGSASAGS